MKVFVSYCRSNRADVLPQVQTLRAAGHTVFFDEHSIDPGEAWESRIGNALATADEVWVFWSAQAAASQWVEREWRAASERGVTLKPALLDATPLPSDLSDWPATDCRPSLGIAGPQAANPRAGFRALGLFFSDVAAARRCLDPLRPALEGCAGPRVVRVVGDADSGRGVLADRLARRLELEHDCQIISVKVSRPIVATTEDREVEPLLDSISALGSAAILIAQQVRHAAPTGEDALVGTAVLADRVLRASRIRPVVLVLEQIDQSVQGDWALFFYQLATRAAREHAPLVIITTTATSRPQSLVGLEATYAELEQDWGGVIQAPVERLSGRRGVSIALDQCFEPNHFPVGFAERLYASTRGIAEHLVTCLETMLDTGAIRHASDAWRLDDIRLKADLRAYDPTGCGQRFEQVIPIGERCTPEEFERNQILWDIVRHGALIGDVFPLVPVLAALGLPVEGDAIDAFVDPLDDLLVDELKLLADAEVGEDYPGAPVGYRFVSPLAREFALSHVAPMLRPRMAETLATIIESVVPERPALGAAEVLARLHTEAGHVERASHFQKFVDWHIATGGWPTLTDALVGRMEDLPQDAQQPIVFGLRRLLDRVSLSELTTRLAVARCLAAIAKTADMTDARAYAHYKEAETLTFLVKWDGAAVAAKAGYRLAIQAGNTDLAGASLACFADMQLAKDRNAAAARLAMAALELSPPEGQGTAQALWTMARLSEKAGQFDEACKLLEDIVAHPAVAGRPIRRVETRIMIGQVRQRQGRADLAIVEFDAAAADCRARNDRLSLGECQTYASRAYRDLGKFDDAASELEAAIQSFREVGARWREGVCLHEAAETEVSRGNVAAALDFATAGLKQLLEFGDSPMVVSTRTLVAEIKATL
jgi:hypothetical protein